MNFSDLNSLLPLALACIMGIGWLFRLESKAGSKADALLVQQIQAEVRNKADNAALQLSQAEVAALKVENAAIKARADAQDAAIKAAMEGHNNTTIEVVRLQEQIKHLTEVIERLLARDEQEQAPRRRRTTENRG